MADQARLLHQDKMMSLGRLAASVAHEINNPLSGILNYIRLMLRAFKKGPLPADKQKQFGGYLELVEAETDRCSTIVSSLLTFSRRSPISVGPVSINAIVERSIVLAGHRLEMANVTLDDRVQDDLPEIRGDANQLQQCLLNLMFNAVDAMPEGGRLTLASALEEEPATVVLTVTDTGTGIENEALEHIFEPFFTTKTKGSGLGLAFVQRAVQDHKGKITVDSTPGERTCFRIVLPRIAPPDR